MIHLLFKNWLIVAFLLVFAILSVAANKLTKTAGATGFIIGLLVFAGAGYIGIAMVAAFFVLATIATSAGMRVKQQAGLAETDKGKRTAGQVIANAGVAAMLGLATVVAPADQQLFSLMMAASLASATSDTLSSELGNVYGKQFYNILTFKPDVKGENGVVSLEGTLAGIVGSVAIAIVFALQNGFNKWTAIIAACGMIGNFADSYLGATVERKHLINNNAVNFINTAIAAAAMFLVYLVLQKSA